ncbi:MAG: alpha/beta hydrolase [Pseudomonadota bacterium]
MPVLDVKGRAIAYREQGKKRPSLLLVHGAGCSSLTFIELLHMIGRNQHVVALDLPGHGKSAAFDFPIAPEDLLLRHRDVVADFAEKLGLGCFVLAGHSMGGAIAQHFALEYADRLEGLILMATAARLLVAKAVFSAIEQDFDQFPQMLSKVAYSPASAPSQVSRWAAEQIQAPKEVVMADFRACACFDLRTEVSGITTPTTIFSGADDLLTPPKLQKRLMELIPNSRLEILSRAGHFLFRERPDEVADLLINPIRQNGQRS